MSKNFSFKNNVLHLCSTCVLILFPLAAYAKDFFGLNLCGTVTVNDIKTSINKAQSTVSKEDKDDTLNTISISTDDYTIADQKLNVTFTLFKNKLYKIQIDPAEKIGDIISAKYNFIRSEDTSTSVTKEKIFIYDSKDKNIEIFETIGYLNVSLISRSWHHATYRCKPLNSQVEYLFDKNKKMEQLRKSGADKL